MTENDKIENQVGLVFQHVARLRTRYFDQQLAKHGLTSAQVFAINYLLREDGLTQVELSRLLGIGTVAVSGLVDRLEANGWVARKADSRDRRSNRVWLTDKVAEKVGNLKEAGKAVNDASFKGMSKQEQDALVTALRVVRDNLKLATCDTPDAAL